MKPKCPDFCGITNAVLLTMLVFHIAAPIIMYLHSTHIFMRHRKNMMTESKDVEGHEAAFPRKLQHSEEKQRTGFASQTLVKTHLP